jgi:hypothetical protein
MTIGGWVIMIVSVGSVACLFFWCLWKVLVTPQESEKLHGFDPHTPDFDEDKAKKM